MRFERPVILGDATGEMRDMSESGSTVFFYADGAYKLGDEVTFAIEASAHDESGVIIKRSLVKCQGVVVRTERRDERMGVAVRITEPVVEAKHVMAYA